jgi:uncharacterized protein (DUF58 family)
MKFFNKYIWDLFLPLRFYVAAGLAILFFILSFLFPTLLPIAKIYFYTICILFLLDYTFVFFRDKPLSATRKISNRLSNGEDNIVELVIENKLPYFIKAEIIDELPLQLQERNFTIKATLAANETASYKYSINPVERGTYDFGNVVVLFKSQLGLVLRRQKLGENDLVSVYPAFSQLGKYALIAQTSTNDYGSKRMRKIGQSMEFEQIKEYVSGDDIRTINWKATARKGSLMINNYTDEKSQQVYIIIDKGRLMKMPFNGLSLLDYSINAALALSNICLQKQDKIGLVTFNEKIGSILAADRKPIQREKILQLLYKENTSFLESDFEMLYTQVRNKIKQRSLLILFTNFESNSGLKRQINYLRSIAKHHLLLVVFFENTELTKLSVAHANTVEDVYIKTIADKLAYEKRMLIKELMQYGIIAIQSSPQSLTVNSINKYLELKSKQML